MMALARKRNILFLTDCLVDLTGGAERQIFELLRGLDKQKYNIAIASLECGGCAPRDVIESTGCKLAVFPVKRIYGFSGFREGIRFIKFLKKEKTDILLTYHFSSDIWGTILARIAGCPCIISNRRDMGFWRSKKHILTYRAINRYVKKIIVNAEAIKAMVLSAEFIPDKKIKVIYNGIRHRQITNSKARIENLKKDLGIKEDDVVIMHVANLRHVKGHKYLLKALAEIVVRHSNIKLVLVGEDRLNGQLNGAVNELGIEKCVIFLGKRGDARELLNVADICVLPSLSEGMSNSILEYMAAGKPVVATRVGGTPELIQDKVNGLLVDRENVQQLKDALVALIISPDKRRIMGENGLKLIQEKFSMQKMIEAYEGLFDSSVNL